MEKERWNKNPYYVAIVEETTLHRIEIPIKDYEELGGSCPLNGLRLSKEAFASKGWKDGSYCDDYPELDTLEVLEIREGEDAWR